MNLILAAMGIWLAGGLLCLAAGRRPRLAQLLGPVVAVLGCAIALVPALASLLGAPPKPLLLPWSIPFGSFHIAMDALSALFAVPLLVVCALAAVFGHGYLRSFGDRKNLGASWFFYSLLTASMLLVVIARNWVLFLLSWEAMSLASFFLVMFEHEEESTRRAGWTYLVATHIGTAFLLVLFVWLGQETGSLDWGPLPPAGSRPAFAGAAFVFAVIGFGTKAGFIPLHVWLPEAHPAAPSHVSAVMSGVMIKTGIYGLVRTLTFLGPPPPWFGWLLIAIGAVSGILGVLFALAQHDLKRLLAYHSVENIGIIALGLGLGLLGISYDNPLMALLGFAGALLHVINHALFKSLLFLGAGAVLHATGTREIDRLGGLLKRLPKTGTTFLVGAAAISGLPPLNGFVSEFLIYLAALYGLSRAGDSPAGAALGSLIVIGSLALIGGLAVACFTKAFGVIFLGEPRSDRAAQAREGGKTMTLPLILLAALCALIGFSGPLLLSLLAPALALLLPPAMIREAMAGTAGGRHALWMISCGAAGVLALAAGLLWLRRRFLREKEVAAAGTWDCGYARPTARMQYTASSYAEPITRLFRPLLGTRGRSDLDPGLFPRSASFHSETPDLFRERLYRPLFAAVDAGLSRFRWLQHGRLNLYILYIVLALIALLIWKLR